VSTQCSPRDASAYQGGARAIAHRASALHRALLQLYGARCEAFDFKASL
jgi:hypothetical protein